MAPIKDLGTGLPFSPTQQELLLQTLVDIRTLNIIVVAAIAFIILPLCVQLIRQQQCTRRRDPESDIADRLRGGAHHKPANPTMSTAAPRSTTQQRTGSASSCGGSILRLGRGIHHDRHNRSRSTSNTNSNSNTSQSRSLEYGSCSCTPPSSKKSVRFADTPDVRHAPDREHEYKHTGAGSDAARVRFLAEQRADEEKERILFARVSKGSLQKASESEEPEESGEQDRATKVMFDVPEWRRLLVLKDSSGRPGAPAVADLDLDLELQLNVDSNADADAVAVVDTAGTEKGTYLDEDAEIEGTHVGLRKAQEEEWSEEFRHI
ncbi:hypothetical protein PVAG01_05443 [Phlyctema vagabunda]|uniref:Uncharacterized protein n=1 Tax=Phlyctema vagabunda TaxID=108571 RepID=A0ABR4PL86_9HELO